MVNELGDRIGSSDKRFIDRLNKNEEKNLRIYEQTAGKKESSEEIQIGYDRLSAENLKEAREFIDKIFPFEEGKPGKSLDLAISEEIQGKSDGIEHNYNYWVIKDSSKKLIGVAGFTDIKGDKPEHCWGGWLGIDPALRGAGLGPRVREFLVEEAKKRGKTDYYSITSNHPDMVGNNKFFAKVGSRIVAVFDGPRLRINQKECLVPRPVLDGIGKEYGRFIADGVNIYIRRKRLA